jgi:hypothetical protein
MNTIPRSATIRIEPIERATHLQALVSYRLEPGADKGAFLVKKNPKQPYRAVFGFEVAGTHNCLNDEELIAAVERLENGLGNLLPHERLTFHAMAIKSDRERQEHLDELIARAEDPETIFLAFGEKKRTRELTEKGWREPKKLYVFVTYQEKKTRQYHDWLDRLAIEVRALWYRYTGKRRRQRVAALDTFLRRAWLDGWIFWRQTLAITFQQRIRPLTADELWKYLTHEIDPDRPLDEIPQLIVVEPNAIREEVRNELHGRSLLISRREPIAGREYVRVGNDYIATLTFWSKPGGWSGQRKQLQYLQDLIDLDIVTDVDIFTQIVSGNDKKTRYLLGRATRTSVKKANDRQSKNEVDVGSMVNAEAGIEAQRQMIAGNKPLYVATVIRVRRPSLLELEEACSFIENFFARPALVVRERHVTWKLWLQCLPIVDEDLLTAPFGSRRFLYLQKEAIGFLPVLKPREIDREGLELIASDGGTPLFIDLFNPGPGKHRHLAVFGTTRSGKSVLAAEILFQALIRRIPVVAMDYPQQDGSSTYTGFAEFLGPELASYVNVLNESFNLFDRPDLSAYAPDSEEYRVRAITFKDFILRCLTTMVVGDTTGDIELSSLIKMFLNEGVDRFLEDTETIAAYEAAEAAGLETPEWGGMPTLKTFRRFFESLVGKAHFEGKLPGTLRGAGENSLATGAGIETLIRKALGMISLRLDYWEKSTIGRCISNPSTVNSKAPFVVLAFTNVTSDEDSAILSLVAYAAALRKALSNPISIYFIDEAPILFRFKSVVSGVAALISNGAKAGVRIVLSSQEPNTIADSGYGAQIFANIGTVLVGRIRPAAIEAFTALNYDRERIAQCVDFTENSIQLARSWLCINDNTYTFTKFPVNPLLLALVANNPNEREAWKRVARACPDKFTATETFARALAEAIQTGEPLDRVVSRYLPDRSLPLTSLESGVLL